MRKTTEEMEQPAKQWQMEALNTELKEVNSKLDNIMRSQNSYVSQAQLKEVERKTKEYADNKVSVLRAKYDPLYRLFWALVTAVAVQAIFLAYQLVVLQQGD